MCPTARTVRLDEDRFVMYCEHGGVSLTWLGCSLHMQADEFSAIVGMFTAGRGAHAHYILDHCQDKWAFWSRNTCLLLSSNEAQQLLGLLKRAEPYIQEVEISLKGAGGRLHTLSSVLTPRLLN